MTDDRSLSSPLGRVRRALIPASDLQTAQNLLREAFALSHEKLSPAAQRVLFEFAIELVAREARRSW
jgi:hypothetical protein